MTPQQKRCDDLWQMCIKKRAGFASELSGQSEDVYLHAHHLANKPNLLLRFSLLNGICLTSYEHQYEAHAQENWGRSRLLAMKGKSTHAKFKDKVRALRGEDIYERLQEIKNDRSKVDLDEIEEMLKTKLKEL